MRLIICCIAAALAGCIPTFDQVKASPVRETVTVSGPTRCVYEKSMQAVGGEIITGAPYQGYLEPDGSRAWIRFGFALVEMSDAGDQTLVTRKSTIEGPGPAMILVMRTVASDPCSPTGPKPLPTLQPIASPQQRK